MKVEMFVRVVPDPFLGGSKWGCAVTIVPGTMLIFSSAAREQYFVTYS